MKSTYRLIALSSLAFACASQQPSDAPARTETAPSTQQLQTRTHDMQALMDRIHETNDLQERHRLMQEHMQSMRDGMTMMGRMMREPDDVSTEGGECARGDTECRMQRMQGQQQAANQRMGMMQMMMAQMMGQMMQRDAEGSAEQPAEEPGNAQDHEAHH